MLALAETRLPLLVLRLVVALTPLLHARRHDRSPETRGAAFGWLAISVQLGTAASPLVNGWVAASSLPRVYLMNAALAWVGAAWWCSREILTRKSA